MPFPEDFSTTADADLEVRGDLEKQSVIIGGNVNVRRSEYTKDIELADLINRRPETPITEGGGSGTGLFGATTSLDLTIQGRDALVVRNNLADMVGSVNLHVYGPMDDPVIAGRIAGVWKRTITKRHLTVSAQPFGAPLTEAQGARLARATQHYRRYLELEKG